MGWLRTFIRGRGDDQKATEKARKQQRLDDKQTADQAERCRLEEQNRKNRENLDRERDRIRREEEDRRIQREQQQERWRREEQHRN